MLTKSRVVQLLFMMVVLLSLFFWRTFDTDFAGDINVPSDTETRVDLLRCDYKNACEFVTEHGTFLLSIKNTPIKAEEWIDFELLTPSANSEINQSKIVGKSMFMGRIPVTFNKTDEKTFNARSLVGACTTDEMIWQLEITTSNGDISDTLLFDFMVKK